MLGKPNEIEYQDKKRMGKEETLKYLFLYSTHKFSSYKRKLIPPIYMKNHEFTKY